MTGWKKGRKKKGRREQQSQETHTDVPELRFSYPTQSKMLKCADNADLITTKADDAGDVVTFMFESPGTSVFFFSTLATKQRRHIPTRDRQIRDWFEKLRRVEFAFRRFLFSIPVFCFPTFAYSLPTRPFSDTSSRDCYIITLMTNHRP